MRFVTIAPPVFDVDLDLRYATADNLTGRPIFARPLCLLHPDAAAALARAIRLAVAQGLRLHVFDGYRPPAAQWALWNVLPDPTFIADPRVGSSHGRGVAIDLTLAQADGTVLEMGTGFDDMRPIAWHADTSISVEAQRNRALLLGIMAAAGWQHYAYEWWHYQLPGASSYPLVEDGVLGPSLMGSGNSSPG
ncbi:D-alanyl-D-alanine dipeptidase [Niveispirillum cyanobacteriorum]|uniref:D-alanyl-D-alanine dipeptidase n=1 Tax=Niveispirillum cyanobacteriorum TaxID=1612173 RepID=A0A2K9NCH8_9PROT|nr:D-alanyl-D-alanine dipeptidase [Niveispirillum cyanobacteriorum]AUN30256.1 D-alanyl-D-alanine dipeptidase [Niveispirillum cyanobacteriorum]GGE56367.1 D-alanyl-D-alanine dipeptidase [Niveispirillum cyanobacteriorum]